MEMEVRNDEAKGHNVYAQPKHSLDALRQRWFAVLVTHTCKYFATPNSRLISTVPRAEVRREKNELVN